MPPSESARSVSAGEIDEVEDYIRSRQLARRRRSAAAARLDVLDADAEFTWDTPTGGARGEVSTDGIVRGEVVELSVDDAWRAAAAARHASPRALDESLDQWGSRVTEAAPAPIMALRDPFDEPAVAPNGRRTVVITGRGAEGYHARRNHRPVLRPHERAGFRPDRVAMWAVVLCLALLLVAATSSHAAVLALHIAR
jgi:hypothetical protein